MKNQASIPTSRANFPFLLFAPLGLIFSLMIGYLVFGAITSSFTYQYLFLDEERVLAPVFLGLGYLLRFICAGAASFFVWNALELTYFWVWPNQKKAIPEVAPVGINPPQAEFSELVGRSISAIETSAVVGDDGKPEISAISLDDGSKIQFSRSSIIHTPAA